MIMTRIVWWLGEPVPVLHVRRGYSTRVTVRIGDRECELLAYPGVPIGTLPYEARLRDTPGLTQIVDCYGPGNAPRNVIAYWGEYASQQPHPTQPPNRGSGH